MTEKKGGEDRGCHFQFWESNRRVNRWVREIIFQDRLGRVHYLRGDQLPHAVCLMTGESSTERGIAEILMDPNKRVPRSVTPSEPKAWPSARDALHIVFGLSFALLCRVLVAVVEAAS